MVGWLVDGLVGLVVWFALNEFCFFFPSAAAKKNGIQKGQNMEGRRTKTKIGSEVGDEDDDEVEVFRGTYTHTHTHTRTYTAKGEYWISMK